MTASREGGLLGALDRLIGWMTRAAGQLAALMCAILIVTTTFSVVVYQRGITIAWLDDVLRMLLIWLVYLGSVSLSFRNDHIAMDALYLRMPPRLRRLVDVAVGLLGVVLCVAVARFGFDSMSFLYSVLTGARRAPDDAPPALPQV
jgi:TRAP-type C4-dicarboxylate transport system permease small subunit